MPLGATPGGRAMTAGTLTYAHALPTGIDARCRGWTPSGEGSTDCSAAGLEPSRGPTGDIAQSRC